jgi:hypothetical protein
MTEGRQSRWPRRPSSLALMPNPLAEPNPSLPYESQWVIPFQAALQKTIGKNHA